MKKLAFIVICVLGILSLASCRSTSKSCGLADTTTIEINLNQDILV